MPLRPALLPGALCALLSVLPCGLLVPLQAQNSEPAGEGRWSRHVPTTASPPTLDGRIHASEWRGAAVIDDLMQIEPREGVKPSEKTVVYLLVDHDNLYIALQAFDSEPEGILASQITRDAVLDPDDRIELVFDTFHDHRNGYFFQIGPGGSKGDALIANNGTFFNKDWDGIWQGKAVIHERGWSAEIALPAKTLSLQAGLDTWGFNLRRYIKRKNEQAQWAHPTRRDRLFQMSSAGTLTGLSVLDPGVGLDVVPFLSSKNQRTYDPDRESTRVEPGLDVRYKITPSLTGTFTANTDFAETEVDSRVVNLTRFPVFFPEKRDFFLEDSGIFSFGDLEEDLVPFFSRRIGLSAQGEPVPILAGAKLTGRVGRVNLGVLDVATDELGTQAGTTLPRKNLAVARASVNVLSESQAGVLFTAGDPGSDGDNALAGADFSWRTRRFRGNRVLRLDAFALTTRDEPEDAPSPIDGHAFGVALSYPNDTVEAELALQEISDGFRPDLGFVRRRDVRLARGNFEWRPRPRTGPVRRLSFGVRPTVYWRLSDRRVESAEARITPAEVLFHSGDRFEVVYIPSEERLIEPFEIAEGVIIPPGTYRFDRYELQIEMADTRRVYGEIEVQTGTFFTGRRDTYTANVSFRPLRKLTLTTELEHNDVRLDEGDFTTSLVRLRSTVDFNPEISWITFAQWDDLTDSLGINSRLRWILSPGREIFLVWNRAFDTRNPLERGRDFTLGPTSTDTTAKVEYTLRF
jgi:hypothetical protein